MVGSFIGVQMLLIQLSQLCGPHRVGKIRQHNKGVVVQVSDTVVEPYNATLSVHQLVENADECMVCSYP